VLTSFEADPGFAKRFWAKVDRRGPEDCWEWRSPATSTFGYGRIKAGDRLWSAHRVSYVLAHGQVPPGLWVLHSCDNPLCVNPSHLYAGTRSQNMKDAFLRGRVTIPNTKLTASDVREIRAQLRAGLTNRAIATRFGIDPSYVSKIRTGKTWSHLPDLEEAA